MTESVRTQLYWVGVKYVNKQCYPISDQRVVWDGGSKTLELLCLLDLNYRHIM